MKTLYYFLLSCLLVMLVNIALAQQKEQLPPKLKRAFNQYYVGQRLQKQNFLDSASKFYIKALPVFESYKRYYHQLQCLSLLSENHFFTEKYAQAEIFADSLLNIVARRKFLKNRSGLRSIAMEKSADVLSIKSKIAYQKRDFENGVLFSQEAINHLLSPKNKNWKKVSENYLHISKLHHALGHYDRAIGSLDTTLDLYVQYQAENLKAIFQISKLLAENYIEVGNTVQAQDHIAQAMGIFEKIDDKNDDLFTQNYPLAWQTYLFGQIQDYKGNYDSALFLHKQALNEYLAKPQSSVECIALAYLNIGIAYQKKGLYYRALEYQQKALQVLADVSREFQLTEAKIFDHLGLVYALMGDIDQAIYYQEKSLQIREEKLSANHPEKAWGALHLGETYFLRKMYAKAEKYYLQALYICEDALQPTHPLFAAIYNSIGVLAQAQKRGEFASAHFKKALDIYEKTLHQPQHPAIAKIYDNLSLLFEQEKKYIEAMEYSLKSLGIYETVLGLKHPALGEGYYHLGLISEQLQKPEEALNYYQKAVNAIVPDFESKDVYALPSLKNVLADNLLLEILSNKANLIQKQAKNDSNLLIKALQTYSLCAELIDKMRNGYKAEGSKLFLSQHSIPLYEAGIELSLKIYELTQDTKYYAEAFAFSEKSKAGVLRAAIADSKAKKVAGIPDSLIAYEQQLRADLSLLDKAFFKEQEKKELADHEKVVKLRNQIFEQKAKYDKLIDFLENAYPEYYMLKYETYKVDIQQVIEKLLKHRKDKFTLVEYFVGNEHIYIFTASEQGYRIRKMPKNQNFEATLRGFRASIIYKVPEKIYEYSTLLYKQLFQPAEPQIISNNVLIIPDATLGNIPFEALISDQNKEKAMEYLEKAEFHKLPYLIKKYKISYAYSSILLLDDKENTGIAENDYLGFAPVFTDSLERGDIFVQRTLSDEDSTVINIEVPRDIFMEGRFISALPGTEQEVKNIATFFDKQKRKSLIFTKKAAKEEIIKSNILGNYKYLHFATHGFVSMEEPNFSGLLLFPQPNSKEDGVLYANEIYALKLNADLVVLSACETGIGKVIRGEGVIGLSRSFLFAGAKNIVVSLWKVADQSTANLMTQFYKRMLKDKKLNKSDALHQAKLDLIKTKHHAMPYYWASFVLVGNKL